MKKVTQFILTGLILAYLFSQKTSLAITYNSDVSASVPSSYFYGPDLISPPDNHATNSARTSFIWKRPAPTPLGSSLHHYDLFIDDAVFAASIPDNLTTQDYYFYTASASANYFYLALKQDQAQGYHTWRVAVYDDIGQNTATGNWTYYIDSLAPFISLTKVNTTTYTWDTSVTGSIPEESQRYLTTTTNSPKLSGKVETNANFQFSLICPSGAHVGCTNQAWISNSTDGNWEQQLTNLVANTNYSVVLSATDATNNTTIFPTFYLKYTTSGTTSTATITTTPSPTLPPLTTTPSQIPLPSTKLTLTPPPNLAAQITPTPFIAKAPPAPTPPPKRKQVAVVEGPNYLFILLIVLLLLGLPTHLFLSGFGLSVKVQDSIKFLLVYGFPFLRQQNARTRPFSNIVMYDPKNLNKTLYNTLSDSNGYFQIPKDLPQQIFIKITKTGFMWKDQILTRNTILSSCLTTHQKKYLTDKEKLQIYIYNNIRSVPLALAIITSGVCMFYLRNTFTYLYFYLSLQYTYSEYFYQKPQGK